MPGLVVGLQESAGRPQGLAYRGRMRRLIRFLRVGLWDLDLRAVGWPRRLLLASLRVVLHTVSQYGSHLVGIRASGLSLVTLLAVVPLLAVVFAIAGAFGFRENLEAMLERNAGDLPEQLQAAVVSIHQLVQRTSFKALGGIGTLMLAWTGLSLFTRVEESLNFTWRTEGSRAWLRRMTSFVALVVLVPALLLGALAISAALQGGPLVEKLRVELPWLMQFYDAGLWLVPHAMAWAAMTALYRFMPSTEVRWRPAIVSGVLAGSALLFMHAAYVGLQIGVARSNAIYATLAALPLLLIYLQLLWTIVLLGAEVGYALQNLHLIGPDGDPARIPFAVRERVALRLFERAAQAHEAGAGPLDLTREAQQVDLPREWLDAVVVELEAAGLLARVAGDRVLPARPAARVALAEVLAAVRGVVPPKVRSRLDLSERLDKALDEAEALRAGVGGGVFAARVPNEQ
jgi:membrane protein